MNILTELELLIRARYPILYLASWEEGRVLEMMVDIATRRQKRVYEWSCTSGLVPANSGGESARQRHQATRDPIAALDQVVEQVERAIFVFKDLHPFLNRQHSDVVRRLKEIAVHLKESTKTVVLLSPVVEIPAELEKEVTLVTVPLPTRDDLDRLLSEIVDDIREAREVEIDLAAEDREPLLKAALGLTLGEAENVFARILVQERGLSAADVDSVLAEKQQIVRKSGLLEYCAAEETLGDVGGLSVLKEWLRKRKLAFSDAARLFGLPAPRGVLLLGVQGCGKSLCAKAVSRLWQLPLLKFDVGRMFGSFVGSSEENVRRAIAVAESVAPAILWVDEIDKALSGIAGSGVSDGGTTARVFGTLLTWLSEKTAPVFVVATANDVSQLPAELLRKGRLDEIFFVDLPGVEERRDTLEIHLSRRSRDPAGFKLQELAQASEDFSGAELEQAVVSALYDAYDEQGEVTTAHVLTAIRETVPLARTMAEQVGRLRDWAQGRARQASAVSTGRPNPVGTEIAPS